MAQTLCPRLTLAQRPDIRYKHHYCNDDLEACGMLEDNITDILINEIEIRLPQVPRITC